MKMRPIFWMGFAIIALSNVVFALENKNPVATELIIESDKVYDPNQLSLDSIETYEKNFNFDWSDQSAKINNKQITDIESFVKKAKPETLAKLNDKEKESLGRILYKLGTYYLHFLKNANRAIPMLARADDYLKESKDKLWNYDHLGFAYEQNYAQTVKEPDRKKALYYINKVISANRNLKNRQLAFAYYVKGCINNDEKNYAQAENNFKNAIKIYDAIHDDQNEQYKNAKNKLVSVLLDLKGKRKYEEAIQILKDLEQHWQSKNNAQKNIFLAANFLSQGEVYLKIKHNRQAMRALKQSIRLYKHIYGKRSKRLRKPYDLLSTAYNHLGFKKLGLSYRKKANDLLKA